MMAAANFADQVLRELLAAMGGALFVGNLLALVRRRRPRRVDDTDDDTPAGTAPIARTLIYLLIGFTVMVWGIASLTVA